MQPAGRGGIPTFEKREFVSEEYRLRVGDRLFIRVFSLDEEMNRLFNIGGPVGTGAANMSELNTFRVEGDGTISLPKLDNIPVAGKTLRETRHLLRELLSPFFMETTRLDIEVRRVHRYFSVIGEGRSGRFPIDREKINIFEALALAGNIGTFGDRSRLRIIRETNDGVEIVTFDVRSEDIIHSRYFYVHDNDVIYIEPMRVRGVFRITNFGTLANTVMSTITFGTMIYLLIVSNSSDS